MAARHLVVALLLAASVSACDSFGFGQEGEDRTPEGTVQAYLDASVEGDCRAASRLATVDLVRFGLWCDDPRVLSFSGIRITDGTVADQEVVLVVDEVVVGGTALGQQGLQAGDNVVLVVVLKQPDGTWRVSQATGRG